MDFPGEQEPARLGQAEQAPFRLSHHRVSAVTDMSSSSGVKDGSRKNLGGEMVLRPPPYPSILLCVALLLSPLHAQQPSGTIEGIVRDPSGAVVSAAHVTITEKASRFAARLTTSGGGVYRASGLQPGEYEVRVEAPGFELAVRELKAEVGRVTRADVSLQVGVATEAITIRDDEVRVNTAQSPLQGVITRKQIRDLPLNGRNYLELGQLEPGVQINNSGTLVGVEGYNTAIGIAGQSGLQTAVTLDGLNISDDHFGAVLANVSQEAIQEFQVTRSAQDISTGLTATARSTSSPGAGGTRFTAPACSTGATISWPPVSPRTPSPSIASISVSVQEARSVAIASSGLPATSGSNRTSAWRQSRRPSRNIPGRGRRRTTNAWP